MTTTDMTRTEALVNAYLDLKATIERHTNDLTHLKQQIIATIAEGDTVEVAPGVGIRVQAGSRKWSETVARQVLTAEQVERFSVPKLDAKLAQKELPPALYDACKGEPEAPSVRPL